MTPSMLDSTRPASHSTDRARSAVRPGASLAADLGYLSLDTNSWCAAAGGDTYPAMNGSTFRSSCWVRSLVLCKAGLAARFVDVQNGDEDQDADANAWVDDVSS